MGCPRCGASVQLAGPAPGHPVTPPPPQDTPAPPPLPAPPPGMPVVPDFTILRELGKGGMGIVYLARSRGLNRVVALKMIRPSAGDLPQDLARFYSEAEAMARLKHPGVVQIHQVGEYEGRPFLVLEYLDGGSLQQRLTGQPQPVRAAAGLIEQLARIVAFMHRRQVLHRDLKPANILLAPGLTAADADGELAEALECFGSPKIADFGLARQLDREAGLTRGGLVLGTLAYMAPEQARGRRELVGPAADVYGLGAILYELLTGRPPFQAEESGELFEMILNEPPVPPRRLNPQVPRDLEAVCLRCLEKELPRRYRSAADLADDLRRFLRGEPIPPASAGGAGRTPARRGRALWVNGLVAVATACAVSAAWWWAVEIKDRAAQRQQAEKDRDDRFEARRQQAETVARQALATWRAYTTEVAGPLLEGADGKTGLPGTRRDGIQLPGGRAIPFPARFVEKLKDDGVSWTKIRVYSEYPFRDTPILDDWEWAALRSLEDQAGANKGKDPELFEPQVVDGKPAFRYARAIRMTEEACWKCHNLDKWDFKERDKDGNKTGKKKEWGPRDFRGVLEVILLD